MSEAYPDMLVGAGTILTVNQVDRAVKAGAEFIVRGEGRMMLSKMSIYNLRQSLLNYGSF